MTTFVLVFAPVFTALFGLLFALVVALRPPGLPLSVRVPQAHANDPVVLAAIRHFRWSLVLLWVVTAALTVALAIGGQAPLAAFVPVLAYTLLSIVALVLSRRAIIRAKREGNWFEGIPVRVSAQITEPAYHHPPVVWPALAAIVLAITTAVDVALYPTLPDPIPVHFNVAGHPDGWAAKSVLSVFGLLMIGTAMVVLLTVLSIVAAKYATRTQSDDTAEQAALRSRVQRGLLTSLLSELAFVIALGISAVELGQRLAPSVTWLTAACAIGLAVLVMVVVITNVARARMRPRPADARDALHPRPDAADDDQHWKGGIFYVNPDDPALMVPRRFGLGWTLNLGRPAGVALAVVLLLMIAALVTTAILVAHTR